MFIKVTRHIFAEAMQGSFSRVGARALFEYLEEAEDGVEFDSLAIRAEFAEYSSATVAAQYYGWEVEADMYDADDNERPQEDIDEENEESALAWLQRRTSVIEFDRGVIIQQF